MNPPQSKEGLSIGPNQKPPVLFEDEYELWVNRFKLFIQRKEYGHLILRSIEEGRGFLTIVVNGKEVPKTIRIQYNADRCPHHQSERYHKCRSNRDDRSNSYEEHQYEDRYERDPDRKGYD